MILTIALLAGCAAVDWSGPRFPHRLTISRVNPALAIVWWLPACAGVAVTVVASAPWPGRSSSDLRVPARTCAAIP